MCMTFRLSMYALHNANLKNYAPKVLLNSLSFGIAEAFFDSGYANSWCVMKVFYPFLGLAYLPLEI